MGAARAVLVSDPALAGADALAAAKVLAAATAKPATSIWSRGHRVLRRLRGTVPERIAEVLGFVTIPFAKTGRRRRRRCC